jgi:L-fuculose-phosphate aldolase
MVGEAIVDHNALILANHGVLTVGKNLTEALWRLERCELLARSVVIARLFGGEKPLPEK